MDEQQNDERPGKTSPKMDQAGAAGSPGEAGGTSPSPGPAHL